MDLFGSSQQPIAPPPIIEAPPPMPIPLPDDLSTKRVKKKSLVGQRQRSGRASTILTDESDRLGG